ncbi:HIT family protein [Halorubrum vacuolatum]|uniref:Diadenosine tetraphosphate (Ap4A) hydrolase n=1 Tax=Halorubrum vacuolatum TaxID=63740 RepID=A0A238VJD6_HALVU|nr:hypothetical protein [Halorubrum vacuolatum]SNR34485.1 Diadenosine tetraphosphate (Ap4A) hydrolase [Halorubrum vacuolatum]
MSTEKCEFCGIVSGIEELYQTNPHIENKYDPPYYSRYWVAWPDPAPLTKGHILLVPYQHELSIARLSRHQKEDLVRTSTLLSDSLQEYFDEQKNTLYFEHGSTKIDEETGCIVHPHFHLIFAEDDILDSVDSTIWNSYNSLMTAWDKLNTGYYLFGRLDGNRTYGAGIEESGELRCKMFLRQFFANKLSKRELYNYHRYSEGMESDDLCSSVPMYDRILRSFRNP